MPLSTWIWFPRGLHAALDAEESLYGYVTKQIDFHLSELLAGTSSNND